MKRILIAAALALTAAPLLAADVALSVSIGQPGFYGRIDMGGYQRPPVIYRQPIAARYVEVDRQPIYLHVPPGHAKNWRRHCSKYYACDERVYFVRNDWYDREYVPHYQDRYRGDDGRHGNNWDDRPGGHNKSGHKR